MMAFSICTKIFSLIALLSAPALTTARPILPRDANATLAFELYASHSGLDGVNVHLLPLNANGGVFWVGGPLGEKDTATYCPLVDQTLCPPGYFTQFLGKPGLSGVSMVSPAALPLASFLNILADINTQNTQVPGGQQLYVAPNGALSFTQAHSAFTPAGSSFGPFNITLSKEANGPALFQYAGPGAKAFGSKFLGCSAKGREHGPYQVFVDTEGLSNADVLGGCVKECIAFGAIFFPDQSKNHGPAAWQYT